MIRNLLALGAATVVAGACGGGNDLPVPAALAVVAETDGQTAFAGALLAQSLAVSVTDAQGITVPRAEVRWMVTQGTGVGLSDAVTTSDGNGRAEVAVTLGQAAGGYAVRAELVANTQAAVTFAMTAVAPPQIGALLPGSFTGGDTLTIQGTDLGDTLQVEIGGTLARVLAAGVLAVAGTTLDVVVPECLVPGTVTVALTYAAATLDEATGTYEAQSDPLRLQAGEYASFAPAALENCVVFPDADAAGALYLLAPQSVTSLAALAADYTLVGDPLVPAIAATERAEAEPAPYLRFHEFLRQQEAEIARVPKPPLEPQLLAPAAVASGIEVGDSRRFRVCGDVRCSVDNVEMVSARARYVGQHAAIYEDGQTPSPLTDQEFQTLGRLIDDELYEVATDFFGSESDVDQNGLVLVLMTPVVNQLTSQGCHDGIITGFFYAIDIDPAFASDSRSNQGEIFYSVVPDPGGSVTCELSKAFVNRQVPIVFSHEMQHMIGYNQRVLVRGGNSEILWLSEGLSHLSEELAALHLESVGDEQRFSEFAIGNLYNGYIYLQEPGAHFVLGSLGTGTLQERGAAWLFVRWVVDQFGQPVIRRMVETTLTGADNVAAVTGEPFPRLLSEWFLANYVSDLSGFTTPSRLRYTTWSLRAVYESLHQQDSDRYPDPYPLIPQQFTGGAFNVGGTLRSGSGDFYLIQQSGSQRGFTVSFTNPAGGDVSAATVPRLQVIRIQ
ncbi:MAG: IPT/TIG domain-containing protein [Gemmatimonadota bacterium]|nr:MAG: IPT/TIG domain-containing protein [Gemmatimonadota bacterium]